MHCCSFIISIVACLSIILLDPWPPSSLPLYLPSSQCFHSNITNDVDPKQHYICMCVYAKIGVVQLPAIRLPYT